MIALEGVVAVTPNVELAALSRVVAAVVFPETVGFEVGGVVVTGATANTKIKHKLKMLFLRILL